MTKIYPYTPLFGDVELVIERVEIDGTWPGKDLRDLSYRLIDLSALEKKDWQTVRLVAHVEGPADSLSELDSSDRSPQVVLTASCSPTNTRVAASLERSPTDAARWLGELQLNRDDFRDKVVVTATLTAPLDDTESRWMAQSHEWTVYFDEPSIPPIEGTLRVRWVSFEGPEAEAESIPEKARKEPFYVALELQPPVVLLNKDFQGLPDLLSDDDGRPAVERALRQAEYRRIAATVWAQMFNVAVASIVPGEDGADPTMPVVDWQVQTLRALLPRIYPGVGMSEALTRALEDSQGEGSRQLQALSQVAVSDAIAASRSLRRNIDVINTASQS